MYEGKLEIHVTAIVSSCTVAIGYKDSKGVGKYDPPVSSHLLIRL